MSSGPSNQPIQPHIPLERGTQRADGGCIPALVLAGVSRPLRASPWDSHPTAKHLLALQSQCMWVITHHWISPGSCMQMLGCKSCCHPQEIPWRCLSPSFGIIHSAQRGWHRDQTALSSIRRHPPEITGPKSGPDFQKDA